MRPLAFFAVIIACFSAPMAQAAGFRFIDIPADASGPALTGAAWSPCAAPPQEIKFRFVTITAVRNCPIAGEGLPLIVISHGSRGWFGAHRDTAAMLADAGFVVAALDHPGDNATDHTRSDSLSILLDRPADIRRLTDFMLDAWPDASKLDRERIGLFGFSRGAYTGLVIAGGRLDLSRIVPLCPEGFIDGMCAEIGKGEIPTQRPAEDPRIKAVVLADLEFGRAFTSQALENVKVPIQLWASARGGDGVLPEDGATIDRSLPAKPEYHVVPNSAHFAFIVPCSAEASKALPEFCVDAGAFDRVAFHKELNAAMLAFFRQHVVGK
jgi:predicted dienelactone hydrolase